jgi:hypothetical protein
MQLNDFESAWKQLKLINAMHPIESKEILSIIEITDCANRTKLVFLNLVLFMIITIFCQGG